jgi:hypothetical protein
VQDVPLALWEGSLMGHHMDSAYVYITMSESLYSHYTDADRVIISLQRLVSYWITIV